MIEQKTLDFLNQLKNNNDRTWFNDHKEEYQSAQSNFIDLVAILLHHIADFDERLIAVEPKDCLFRIYRDIRFSKNKRPYKTWFSAAMTGSGKRSLFPGYYFHLEPGNIYLGGGIWHPGKEALQHIRGYIVEHHSEFEKIILGKTFKKHFVELSGERLKTAPKGYPKDHPQIRWLRHKDFLVGCTKNNIDFTADDIIAEFAGDYQAMYPFIEFLHRAVL